MARDDAVMSIEEGGEGDFEEKGECGSGLYAPAATTVQTTTRPQDLGKLGEEVEAQYLPPYSNSLSWTL